MYLAGDLGGTKTHLGVFTEGTSRPVPQVVREYVTLDYPGLPAMIDAFLAEIGVAASEIRSTCFGVAGPIKDGVADMTNVPWHVDAREIHERNRLPRVTLLNDVEALVYAVPVLASDELVTLQAGTPVAGGNATLITVGTGFGQAFIHYVGGRTLPLPSEGGHIDFAARTEREIELLRYLTARFGRVDVERVVSGRGLANVAEFTHGGVCPVVAADVDPAAVPAAVSQSAMQGRCPQCREALDLFIAALGSAAGNAAVMGVARGGVFIGGGVPAKILPALQSDLFVTPFRAKPPMHELLASIPVYVITHTEAGLLGSAVYAASSAREG
jgi:glucokinase